jgi:hypothetical protein
VFGKFQRSKIAWKVASYQDVLLHRIVALMDGAASGPRAHPPPPSMAAKLPTSGARCSITRTHVSPRRTTIARPA